MTGYFKNSQLSYIQVVGNGQTTYWGLDEKDKFIGVNVAESSDINISLKDNAINSISFLNQPKATMHPMGELDPVKDFFLLLIFSVVSIYLHKLVDPLYYID